MTELLWDSEAMAALDQVTRRFGEAVESIAEEFAPGDAVTRDDVLRAADVAMDSLTTWTALEPSE